MLLKETSRLIKLYDSNYDIYLDILDSVIEKFSKYVTDLDSQCEAGGVLLGYKIKGKNVIVIDDLTEPQSEDKRYKYYFIRTAFEHIKIINKKRGEKSFYLGNWHTHPFTKIPILSIVDKNTWVSELNECKSTTGFQIFIICAADEFKVWIGKENTTGIYEMKECELLNELYK